jgi:hypothetical protein
MSDVLFILKRKESYGVKHFDEPKGLSTGLLNSASYVNDMLNGMGISSEVEVAVDNNCIDRIVTQHKPKVVIIEALWVVPDKFEILQKLHPTVKWVVRIHSEVPFMAQEGIAYAWITDYLDYANVFVGVNSPRMMSSLCKLHLPQKLESKFIYMPNYYPIDNTLTHIINTKSEYINIGCFGAIRPLKNHLQQALAAIHVANMLGKKLKFHINANRLEMKGEPILHNLRRLFDRQSQNGHELIEHTWMVRDDFLKLCATMDVGMQVSFSETFNIVAADLVNVGVPVVVSNEVPWASSWFIADPTDQYSIERALVRSYEMSIFNRYIHYLNLKSYSNKTSKVWKKLMTTLL